MLLLLQLAVVHCAFAGSPWSDTYTAPARVLPYTLSDACWATYHHFGSVSLLLLCTPARFSGPENLSGLPSALSLPPRPSVSLSSAATPLAHGEQTSNLVSRLRSLHALVSASKVPPSTTDTAEPVNSQTSFDASRESAPA